MEQLNRIELRGIVGSVYIKEFGNAKVANFSVATDHCYKDREGTPVIDTTWFRIVSWESDTIKDLDLLQKGSAVHVIGRVRMQRYTAADGSERSFFEVIASEVELMES